MTFLAYPLANLLLLLYNYLGQNTVVAIAALTILINMALLPLTLSQQKSARKMQELQPEIDKLKKKYAKDQQRLLEEQQKLFRREGVSLGGGCLPLLIQLPIWFGLYRAIVYCVPSTPLDVFRFSQQIYNTWLPGVVGLVPLQSTFLGMDLGQPPNTAQWWSFALPILVGATSVLQQRLLSPSTRSSTDKSTPPSQAELMNRQMQIMMPLMFMMFTLQYATGLSIYFIISNLIRIVQYSIIRVNHDKGRAAGKEGTRRRQGKE